MKMAEEKWSIDKLDDSNWSTWKFQMKHLLLAKELWQYVDGSEVLGTDATANARAEWSDFVTEDELEEMATSNEGEKELSDFVTEDELEEMATSNEEEKELSDIETEDEQEEMATSNKGEKELSDFETEAVQNNLHQYLYVLRLGAL